MAPEKIQAENSTDFHGVRGESLGARLGGIVSVIIGKPTGACIFLRA